VSTWGWVIEYGLVAFLFLLCVGVFFFMWGKDRLWRWLDHRDAKREARARQSGVNPEL
jgi:predicted PurR-regulated permease PerM